MTELLQYFNFSTFCLFVDDTTVSSIKNNVCNYYKTFSGMRFSFMYLINSFTKTINNREGVSGSSLAPRVVATTAVPTTRSQLNLRKIENNSRMGITS